MYKDFYKGEDGDSESYWASENAWATVLDKQYRNTSDLDDLH